MPKIRQFQVKIENGGKIAFKSENHKEMFQRFLSQFDGKEVGIEINEKKSKRSDEQNRYYWLYLGIISEETGFLTEELHEWAKGKFLSEGIKEIFGDKVRKKKSTTGLTRGEFCEYLFNISVTTEVPLPDTSEYFGYSYHK